MKFTVDAGIINRLGVELVGKSETALSELIKNAYDADAKSVTLEFINRNGENSLVITDDGVGMTHEQLENGFMRLSSTEKVHYPYSERFHRARAGRKGIGRFAAHRLGWQLVIITQTLDAEFANQITINWEDYKIDVDLADIENEIITIPKIKDEGTILIINRLRDTWSDAQIRNVYRHSVSILQPDYLSERAKKANTATDKSNTFQIKFILNVDEKPYVIADTNTMLFNKALAVVEGSVDEKGQGNCSITSDALGIYDLGINIQQPFSNLSNINFKAYYYIYDKDNYYNGKISKIELRSIKEMAGSSSGIRIYRNGFRVLPYGDPSNDWLKLNSKYTFQSGVTNIPFGNRNFFGFVEIIDAKGDQFEETASREGLIENSSFEDLTNFIIKALQLSRIKIAEKVFKIRQSEALVKQDINKSFNEQINFLETNVGSITSEILEKNIDPLVTERIHRFNDNFYSLVADLKSKYSSLLEEQGMLRVLSGMGLQIGEFSHEITHYFPAINGDLFRLQNLTKGNEEIATIIKNLALNFSLFKSYTSYFNTTISQNSQRDLKPVLLGKVIGDFYTTIRPNADRLFIEVEIEAQGSDLYSIPMHPSEWNSILFNLYSNSKKAIKKTGHTGKIKINIGRDNSIIYLDFLDNGIGIKEVHQNRIFDAFFSTSDPSEYGDEVNNEFTGTGLGLKIVKDIIDTYDGSIQVAVPEVGYTTLIRVQVPAASENQLEEYGL